MVFDLLKMAAAHHFDTYTFILMIMFLILLFTYIASLLPKFPEALPELGYTGLRIGYSSRLYPL